jgi:hypothetical protein
LNGRHSDDSALAAFRSKRMRAARSAARWGPSSRASGGDMNEDPVAVEGGGGG